MAPYPVTTGFRGRGGFRGRWQRGGFRGAARGGGAGAAAAGAVAPSKPEDRSRTLCVKNLPDGAEVDFFDKLRKHFEVNSLVLDDYSISRH